MRMAEIIFLSLLLSGICRGAVLSVDAGGQADYLNIQEAINASRDGDVIEVKSGVYVGSINFYGKAITVRSIEPEDANTVASTVIRRERKLPSSVVRFDCGEGKQTVLRGFTVESVGEAAGTGYGIYCHYSSPVISNMVILGCMTGVRGEYGTPLVRNSYIGGNSFSGVEIRGGEVLNCTVKGNGLYGFYNCRSNVVRCEISGNKGVGFYDCKGSVINCLIVNNGGGLRDCSAHIGNCTIAFNEGGSGLHGCHGEICNSIIAFNGEYGLNNCRGVIKYNNVWENVLGSYAGGTIPGVRDIHGDPLFAGEGDYHVKSKGGRWERKLEVWVLDEVTSPCVDSGGNYCLEGQVEPEPCGGRINQGVYGGTLEASKTPNGEGLWAAEAPSEGKWIFGKFDVDVSCADGYYWYEVGTRLDSEIEGWMSRTVWRGYDRVEGERRVEKSFVIGSVISPK